MKYRNIMPLIPRKIDDDNNGIPIIGFHFVHHLIILRVFMMCCGCLAMAMGIALTRADSATGFTVGAFILAVPALLVAVLALVLAAK